MKQDAITLPLATKSEKTQMAFAAIVLGVLAVSVVGIVVTWFVCWEPEPEIAKPAICDDTTLQQQKMDRAGWWALTNYLADNCS